MNQKSYTLEVTHDDITDVEVDGVVFSFQFDAVVKTNGVNSSSIEIDSLDIVSLYVVTASDTFINVDTSMLEGKSPTFYKEIVAAIDKKVLQFAKKTRIDSWDEENYEYA